MAKSKKREHLNEDFLSDIEQKPTTAAEIAGAKENTVASEDDDFADLLGGGTQNKETEETKSEDGFSDKLASLTDLVTGLATSVQKLNDTVSKMQQTTEAPEPAPAEPAQEPAQAPAPETGSEEAPPNLDLDLDNAAAQGTDEQTPAEGGEEKAAPAEGGEQQQPAQSEPNTEDKPSESTEEKFDDLGTLDESKEGDDKMSDLYRLNRKSGAKLNSNEGTVIGIMESGKYYKLDGFIKTILEGKIREKIESAKADLKAQFLKEAAEMGEMPKEEPIVEEKKEETSKEDRIGLLDMIKKAKAANNSYTKLDDGTECKEGQCDKKSDEKEPKEDDEKSDSKDEKKDDKKED